MATTTAFDFEGHPTAETRQLVDDETAQPGWTALLGHNTIAAMATAAASLLDAETFSASSQRDALGRVLTAISSPPIRRHTSGSPAASPIDPASQTAAASLRASPLTSPPAATIARARPSSPRAVARPSTSDGLLYGTDDHYQTCLFLGYWK